MYLFISVTISIFIWFCSLINYFDLNSFQQVDRDDVECNLQFLGLLVMENRLKLETKAVISQLRQANVRIIMVTGECNKVPILLRL